MKKRSKAIRIQEPSQGTRKHRCTSVADRKLWRILPCSVNKIMKYLFRSKFLLIVGVEEVSCVMVVTIAECSSW